MKFFDLYHLLYDEDWLRLAHDHVKQNAGSITAGCDGVRIPLGSVRPVAPWMQYVTSSGAPRSVRSSTGSSKETLLPTSITHLDASVKNPEYLTGDPGGCCHTSRVAAASTRHLLQAFVPQLPQGCQRLRAVGKPIQARCGITGAGYNTALDEIVHPMGRHRQHACELGDRQHPGHAPGM